MPEVAQITDLDAERYRRKLTPSRVPPEVLKLSRDPEWPEHARAIAFVRAAMIAFGHKLPGPPRPLKEWRQMARDHERVQASTLRRARPQA
jgi:hypothetical protein